LTAVLAVALAACAHPGPASTAPTDAGHAWTPWSAPANGLSLRVRLPARALRGDRIEVRAGLRFDPAALPPGVTHFDGRVFEDRLRLHFEDPRTGSRVDVEDDDVSERIVETVDPDAPAAGPDDPRFFPIRAGDAGEKEVRFLLARAWDALGPGDWWVSASLEEHRPNTLPFAWTGRAVTEPLALRIDDAPPRRTEVRVPTALRLRRGRAPGVAEVRFGPEESEVVSVESRNGFILGTERWDGVGDSGSWGWGESAPDVHPLVDTLSDLPAGPLDRTYRFVIFEAALTPGSSIGPMQGHNGYRVLWSRALRVTATAGEIEALRR
jgi:hypothetical protein